MMAGANGSQALRLRTTSAAARLSSSPFPSEAGARHTKLVGTTPAIPASGNAEPGTLGSRPVLLWGAETGHKPPPSTPAVRASTPFSSEVGSRDPELDGTTGSGLAALGDGLDMASSPHWTPVGALAGFDSTASTATPVGALAGFDSTASTATPVGALAGFDSATSRATVS